MTIRTAAALTLTLLSGAATAEGRMSAEDIRRDIVGRRIYLATPLGGEIPLFYRRDGRVDGTGEAVGLGRWFRPNDEGRWWIEGDRLCQQWASWYGGERLCFVLTRLSSGQVRWVRDNGESGIARIGP